MEPSEERIGVIGVPGRMASRVARRAAEFPGLCLSAAVARPGDPCVGTELAGVRVQDTADFAATDVWIEFAVAEATPETIAGAVKARRALVVCTTGLSAETLTLAEKAAAEIAIMIAPNTSLGIAVLKAALRLTLRALPDFACEIVEVHHDKKRDAPSGTAIALAQQVQALRPETVAVRGRDGLVGPRQHKELGIHAVRGGGVIGEHSVYLFGEHERLELVHRAEDRDLFAHGALVAARWLAQQKPGSYNIEQCLGLEPPL